MRELTRDGFTLIELIVGLTVAAIALAAGFGALGFVRDNGDRAVNATRAALGGAMQRNLLVEWLDATRTDGQGVPFIGAEAEASGVPTDILVFTTAAATPKSDASTVVALSIDLDPQTPYRGLIAELTGQDIGADVSTIELVPEAGGMRIRYLPETDAAAGWVDGWLSAGDLPRGVELTLSPAPGETLPPLFRIPLRVALPSAR